MASRDNITMSQKIITSLTNPTIKKIVKLRTDKKYRQEENQVIVAGEKIIFELSKKFKFITLIISDKKSSYEKIKAENLIFVSDNIMKKITNNKSPEGIAAVIEIPKEQKLKNPKRILVLDKIADPGNLGTLIRSALAFSFDAIILLPNSADPYNEKALSAARSATFFIPIFFMSLDELEKMAKDLKASFLIADMDGENVNKIKFQEPCFLVLSNESHGISSWTKDYKKVSIPISKDIESLNVAIAGSICMYEIKSKL